MHSLRTLIVPIALPAAMIVAISGCGNGRKTHPVTVKVSFPDGKTLEGAIVAFHSVPDGSKPVSATGRVDADGTCQLTTYSPGDGAIAGHHRVTIAPPPNARASAGYDRTKRSTSQIHPRFLSADTSGLEASVSADGENEFSFEIE